MSDNFSSLSFEQEKIQQITAKTKSIVEDYLNRKINISYGGSTKPSIDDNGYGPIVVYLPEDATKTLVERVYAKLLFGSDVVTFNDLMQDMIAGNIKNQKYHPDAFESVENIYNIFNDLRANHGYEELYQGFKERNPELMKEESKYYNGKIGEIKNPVEALDAVAHGVDLSSTEYDQKLLEQYV